MLAQIIVTFRHKKMVSQYFYHFLDLYDCENERSHFLGTATVIAIAAVVCGVFGVCCFTTGVVLTLDVGLNIGER